MPTDAPFRSTDFLTLIDRMILTARAHTERITDYNAGSVARTLLEAPALEIDALYQAMVLNLLDAIPIAIYQGFDFAALPAVAAAGFVTFSSVQPVTDADRVIPAGTTVRVPGQLTSYQTQADAVIPVGSTSVTVAMACVETGDIGNALSHSVISSDAGMELTVTNEEPISGGRGPETADERRLRFIRFIQSLARGTVASLEYIARTGQKQALNGQIMERVARVAVEETPGYVALWIHNGRGQTSAALVADVARRIEGYWDEFTRQWIPGYRPAGMRVDVRAMIEQPISISMELDAAVAQRTTDLMDEARNAIQSLILMEQPLGVLRPVELINSVLLLSGIDGARLVLPTHSLSVPVNTTFVPGVITLTWNPES